MTKDVVRTKGCSSLTESLELLLQTINMSVKFLNSNRPWDGLVLLAGDFMQPNSNNLVLIMGFVSLYLVKKCFYFLPLLFLEEVLLVTVRNIVFTEDSVSQFPDFI